MIETGTRMEDGVRGGGGGKVFKYRDEKKPSSSESFSTKIGVLKKVVLHLVSTSKIISLHTKKGAERPMHDTTLLNGVKVLKR